MPDQRVKVVVEPRPLGGARGTGNATGVVTKNFRYMYRKFFVAALDRNCSINGTELAWSNRLNR